MKRFRQYLLAGIVLTAMFGLFLGFLTFEKSITFCALPPVKLTLTSAKFLSANEDETIVLGMENMDSDKIPVEFRLKNAGAVHGHIGLAANNAFYQGPVSAQEQVNRELHVNFPCSFGQVLEVLNQEAGLSLWGGVKAQQIGKISDLPIRIGPIPWAKKLFTWTSGICGSLIVFSVTGVIWERVKTAKK
jgi:hypothetical protein